MTHYEMSTIAIALRLAPSQVKLLSVTEMRMRMMKIIDLPESKEELTIGRSMAARVRRQLLRLALWD